MAERVEIRLLGEGWRLLPEGSDFESLRALPGSEWVEARERPLVQGRRRSTSSDDQTAAERTVAAL
jgi:hypothetical protein